MGKIKRSLVSAKFVWFHSVLCYQCSMFQLETIQQTTIDLLPFGNVPSVGTDPDTDDDGKCNARNAFFPLNK